MNASDELLDFLVCNIPSSKLAHFHSSEEVRRRVWDLIERERGEGLLSEERVELDDYLKLEHLLVMAKARARLLSGNGR